MRKQRLDEQQNLIRQLEQQLDEEQGPPMELELEEHEHELERRLGEHDQTVEQPEVSLELVEERAGSRVEEALEQQILKRVPLEWGLEPSGLEQVEVEA